MKVRKDQILENQPVTVTDGTNTAEVMQANGSYGLAVVTPGHVSILNSTTTPLAANATFTGTYEDIINHGVIMLTVIASHASATNGLVVQFSSDGTNIDSTDTYTVAAATGKTFSFQCPTRYFRVVYTNGGTLQTYFRLQTILKPTYVKSSSHRISDSLSLEDDAELIKAVVAGETTAGGGSFVNLKVNPSGSLEVGGVATVGSITNPVTVTSTNLDIRDLTSASDSVTTVATTYSTSSVTSVSGSASSVQLLASTAGRKGAYFYNDSSAICYLKLGTTASTSSFTVAMAAASFYELPQPCYTGRIDAIWVSATGSMRITEIT